MLLPRSTSPVPLLAISISGSNSLRQDKCPLLKQIVNFRDGSGILILANANAK
jgi:hypothetical protein